MTALADTSIFVARESGRELRAEAPRELAVSVVTIAELRLGVLSARDLETRGRRLTTLAGAQLLDPLPIDSRVADAWATLVAGLRSEGRRIGVNDSWIAATAIVHDMPVVTQDGDFADVPGLEVIEL